MDVLFIVKVDAGRQPSVSRFTNKKKLCLKKGRGKKITLKSNTSFPLFKCRDTDDFIDCNLFSEAKLNLGYLGRTYVKIFSVLRDEGC